MNASSNPDSQTSTLTLASPEARNELAVNPPASLVLITAPVSSSQATSLIDAKPLPAPAQPRKIARNGRVARLPKLQRDMVNHMLWNAVPYKNIVAALGEAGFTASERNISNWATGGYLEWRLAQEHVLQHRLDQDHLLDFLRRDDAPELPEVGLQAASTRLSQVLLQKLANADDPEAHLDSYSKLVELLCRLNREISVTQKQRDDSRRSLGREYNPALVKETEQLEAIENERHYSNPPPGSRFSRPAIPPVLPRIPTASSMAQEAEDERLSAETERLKRSTDMLEALKAKLFPASKQIQRPSALIAPSPTPLTLPAPVAVAPAVPAFSIQVPASGIQHPPNAPVPVAAR